MPQILVVEIVMLKERVIGARYQVLEVNQALTPVVSQRTIGARGGGQQLSFGGGDIKFTLAH